VVLTYGNYRIASSEPHYLPLDREDEWRPIRQKEKLSRTLDNLRLARRPKFDWRGNPLPPRDKDRPPSSLDIIGKSQRKQKTCKLNRPKSFTNAAGQKLRECGAAIDHVAGDPALTRAITLTLPADHDAAFIAIAAYSGYIINRLFQPIRRNYAKECLWFFVWEYQKRGALHLHIALYHPCALTGETLGEEMVENWLRILADVGTLSQTDMFCRADMKTYTPREKYQNQNQPMRRSLGAYFSKYAGKQESKQSKHCQKYPVSRFWGCCYPLKDLIKTLSLDYTLVADDDRTISEMVERIMSVLTRFDMNVQSNYDFDIRKNYGNDSSLSVASGSRYTFYCHPRQYETLMKILRETTRTF
jgi:hypothetical protein